MPTPTEIVASTNIVAQYELLQWAVGILVSFITAMGGGIIWLIRESRSERKELAHKSEEDRKEWRAEMIKLQERTLSVLERNNEVVSQNTLQKEQLIKAVERNTRITENLEKVIIEKIR